MKRVLLILLAVLLAACTTDGLSTPQIAPPATANSSPTTGAEVILTPPAPESTITPPPAETALAPTRTPAPTRPPLTTATLRTLSPSCLLPQDYQPIVNRFLAESGKADLEALWESFDAENPVYDLMSSFTNITNEYAHATTYSKMLLLGEYPIAVNRPGAVGYAHCAVLLYMGGEEPEVGVGVLDATLNGEWSGYAYGQVTSEHDLRRFIEDRTGKAVLVRYHVTQDPRDANFVRPGFFSPVMRQLWETSYVTRFRYNPDQLKDSVGNPRGPGMKEMMELLTSWPDENIGLFLDYVIDPIL